MDLIPKLERPTGEGNGYSLQYPCLGNLVERGAGQAVVHVVAEAGHNLATKPQPPPGIHAITYLLVLA